MIQAMKNNYPISLLCEVMAVARSGYHAWAAGRRSVREQRDAALRPKLRAAFEQTRRSYGYPRMTVELRAQNQRVGKTRVARLMKEEGLSGRPKRRYRPQTTQSDHQNPIAPNHLAKVEKITACDQVWPTDITYLPTEAGWLYLAVVIDAYSKRVIGWAFSASLATELVINALQMAIKRRGGRCAPGLLLHSDRGVQYTSERFRAELAAHGITASMSRKANCYDNARAESFFSTLKIEHTYRHRFANHDEARQSTFEWIEGFYNKRRRHSSIGNISPVDFENQTN
jgi:putative transposase